MARLLLLTIPLPSCLITGGAIRVTIRCDAGANAVVGELWPTADH